MTQRPTRLPLFHVIADEILETIASGDVGPGARLPTEAELCEQHVTTRTTVRAAYRRLVDEGWVEKRGLSGYFVREIRQEQWNLAHASAFVDPLAPQGNANQGRSREITTVRTNRPDTTIRNRRLGSLFALDDDDLIACRATVHYRDRKPIAITETYVPYPVTKDSAFMSDAPLDDLFSLFRAGGWRLEGFTDVSATRMPTPAETSFLELPQATPVTEILRIGRFVSATQKERCLLVVHMIYNALGAEFIHDIRA